MPLSRVAIWEALRREEVKQKELTAEHDRLHGAGPSEWDIACLRREAKTRLANTQALPSRQPHEARAILRRLFDAPLSFGSVEEDGRVKFVVEGTGNFSTLLTVSDLSPTPPSNVVSPTGYPAYRRQHSQVKSWQGRSAGWFAGSRSSGTCGKS